MMVVHEMLMMSRRLGRYIGYVKMLRNSRNRFNVTELSEIYMLRPEEVTTILDAIDAHPDWDDEQVAESVYLG